MDRQTLSQYGWIVVVVLVLAILLGMATPFGQTVGAAVTDTVAVMEEKNNSVLDDAFSGEDTPNSEYSQTGTVLVLDDVDENETEITLSGTANSVVKSYGKNLLKQTGFKANSCGLDITQNADGTFTLNGTATANVWIDLIGKRSDGSGANPFYGLPVGTELKGAPLLKSGSATSNTNIGLHYKFSQESGPKLIQGNAKSKTYTLTITEEISSAETINGFYFNCAKDAVFENAVIQPFVLLSSIEDTTYEQFKEPTSVTLNSEGKGTINYNKEIMYLYSSDEFTATYEVDSKKKILINSGLYKKTLALNGDSITSGGSSRISYGKQIADEYEMTLINKAVGGGTIAYGTTTSTSGDNRHWICDTISSMPSDTDYVLFSGGANDYWGKVEIGSLTPGLTDEIDNTTFYGALESIFRQAKEKWPNAKIGFITTHKITGYPTKANAIGYTLNDYYEAIIATCEKYDIPVCDIYNSEFDTSKTEYLNYTADDDGDGKKDGVHPTTEGYELFYVDKVVDFLKTL